MSVDTVRTRPAASFRYQRDTRRKARPSSGIRAPLSLCGAIETARSPRDSDCNILRSKMCRSRRVLQTDDVTRSQKELLPYITKAIRLHRDKLSRTGSVSGTKTRTRRRLDQYSVYLRVWDSRQAGRTFREIAQEIYPKEYPHHPVPRNPIIQRVLDHFRRAEALIQGGYKELA